MEPSPAVDYVKALADANLHSDHTDRTVSIDGTDMRLQYAPEPGVAMRVQPLDAGEPVEGVESVSYDAASERPASYPPGLPWVPGLAVTVLPSTDGAAGGAMWWTVPDADSVLADLLAQSAATGWAQRAGPDPAPIPGMRMVHLQRDEVHRMINVMPMGGAAVISVLDGTRE